MAKRKTKRATGKLSKAPATLSMPPSNGPSFSLEAVMFLASLTYHIRESIQNEAIDTSENKKNIPRSTVESIAKKLKLGAFIAEMDEELL